MGDCLELHRKDINANSLVIQLKMAPNNLPTTTLLSAPLICALTVHIREANGKVQLL